jgi:hypothetical protein
MRELLYEAAKHYRQGNVLAEGGDARGAAVAFEAALRELQAVRPQRMRDVLLAQVYLSRHQLNPEAGDLSDLRFGYAYARSTAEPSVRSLAERLWNETISSGRHLTLSAPKGARRPPPRSVLEGSEGRAESAPATSATSAAGRPAKRSGRRRGGRGKAPPS